MSDTLRRAIAGLAAVGAPFLAAFLTAKGFPVSDAQVTAAEVGILGYLAQSVLNAMHARSVAASVTAGAAAAAAPAKALNS